MAERYIKNLDLHDLSSEGTEVQVIAEKGYLGLTFESSCYGNHSSTFHFAVDNEEKIQELIDYLQEGLKVFKNG